MHNSSLSKNKAFIFAFLGAIIQYYDYHLYGFLAATISKEFFAGASQIEQLKKAYFVMFLGVTAKPFGALFLGYIGDLYGRSRTLTISLICTAVPSLVIAFVPDYNSIGSWAAFILVICRMIISSMVSSGTDGVRLFIYEQISKKRQCYGNGLVVASTVLGSFLASLSSWFFTLEKMPKDAWRVSFLIGAVLGLIMVIFRIRHNVGDFEKIEKDTNESEQFNILNILKGNMQLFFLGTILAGCIGSVYQFHFIFMGTYLFKILGLITESDMKLKIIYALILYMVSAIIGGFSADVFGRRKIAIIATILIVINSLLYAYSLYQNKFFVAFYFLNSIFLGFLIPSALAFIKQSLPKKIRYRMFSLGHAFGSIVISGTTAVFSTYLYKIFALNYLPVCYFIFTIICMIASINILCKRFGADSY